MGLAGRAVLVYPLMPWLVKRGLAAVLLPRSLIHCESRVCRERPLLLVLSAENALSQLSHVTDLMPVWFLSWEKRCEAMRQGAVTSSPWAHVVGVLPLPAGRWSSPRMSCCNYRTLLTSSPCASSREFSREKRGVRKEAWDEREMRNVAVGVGWRTSVVLLLSPPGAGVTPSGRRASWFFFFSFTSWPLASHRA